MKLGTTVKNQKLHSIITIILRHRIVTAAVVLVLLAGTGAAVAMNRQNTGKSGNGNVKGVTVTATQPIGSDQAGAQNTTQTPTTPTPISEPAAQTANSSTSTVVKPSVARAAQSSGSIKPTGTALPAATVTPLPTSSPTPSPTPTPTPTPRTILGGSSTVEILPADTEAVAYGEFSTSDGSNIYWQPLYKNTYWPGNEPNFTNSDLAFMPDSYVYMDTAPNVATNTLGYYIAYTGGQIVTGTPWHEFSVMAVDPASNQPISTVGIRYNFQ